MLARGLSRTGQATDVHVRVFANRHLRTDSLYQALSLCLLRNKAARLRNLDSGGADEIQPDRDDVIEGFRCEPDRYDGAEDASPAVWRVVVLLLGTFDRSACYAN